MINKTWQGYTISKRVQNSNFPVYIKSIYRDEITWTTDYLYAKHYTEKAAKRIDARIDENILNGTFTDKDIIADAPQEDKTMTNALTELQKTKTDVMRGLHAVYGFNFEKPYRVAKIDGSTTVKAMRTAVDADDTYDMVVALVKDWRSYNAVALSPHYTQGFEIDKANRIYSIKGISSGRAFGGFYTKKAFTDARTSYDAETIVIAQNTKYFFSNSDARKYSARFVNNTHAKEMGIRYEIIKTIEHSHRTNIEFKRLGDNAMATTFYNSAEGMDKSGYLVSLYRDDLKKRAEQRRADIKKAEFAKHDYSDRVTTLREVINTKKNLLADELHKATTTKDLRVVRDKLTYWHGLIDLMEDFERFEENIRNKSFASIEACDALYNSILKNAIEKA